MSEAMRPNPDALLAAINEEAARKARGELKVFLGMCPGVGKTYAMLEAAQREHKAGRDVVVGYVETHGRKETDALTRDLEIIPRRSLDISWRGAHRDGPGRHSCPAPGTRASLMSCRTPTFPGRAIPNDGRTS